MKKEQTEGQELQKEIAKLKEELKTMKQIEVSKDQQIAGLNSQLQSKNNEIASLKKPVDKSKDNQLIDKEKELEEKYKNMSAALEQKINSLEMRITQLNHEKGRIDQSNLVLSKQLKERDEEINRLKGEESAESKEKEKEEENQPEIMVTGQSQQPDIQTSLQYEKIIKEKEGELIQSKEHITHMTNEITVLTRERENTMLSLEEAKAQIKETDSKMAKMRANVTEIKKKVEEEMILKTAEINKSNEKLFNDMSMKNKNLEEASKVMKENILILSHEKTQYEDILLKQEDKIKEMTKKNKQAETLLQKSRKEIKDNETHLQELMKIIKNLKKKNEALQITKEEMDQIEYFQKQIDQLKISLDMKDSHYADLLKRHKMLQMNFKKISSQVRMEGTKQFLSEAREMKKKRDISINNKVKQSYNTTDKEEEILVTNKNVIKEKELIIDSYNNNNIKNNGTINDNNLLLSSSNDFTQLVVLPPLKLKTPSLLNMTNISNEGEERKELNQMMSKIINEFV